MTQRTRRRTLIAANALSPMRAQFLLGVVGEYNSTPMASTD